MVETIAVSGPTEVDRGYYELRVNWTGEELLAMTGAQLDRFKGAIAALHELAGSEPERG